MSKLVLRIADTDFSEFAGYYYDTDDKFMERNETLNDYINLYKNTDSIKYFQIECNRSFPMHAIAYICNAVQEHYFVKVEFEDDVKRNRYWLCFHKDDKKDKSKADGSCGQARCIM